LNKKTEEITPIIFGKKLFPAYRGLARDVINDITVVAAILEVFFGRRTGRFNGNNVRKRPKIGHISGPIETFQCIKSNRNFDVKIWKVFIYLHLDFLGN
jgi:hypothetical protein